LASAARAGQGAPAAIHARKAAIVSGGSFRWGPPGHLKTVATLEDVEQQTLVRLAGQERGAAGAALEQGRAGADSKLRERLDGAVATLAVAGENWFDSLAKQFLAGEGEHGADKTEKR
jgi:hypothetical protein